MPTREAIQQRLLERLAELLDLGRDAINTKATFDALGLASRDAVGLSGELQEWLGKSFSPNILYDYPSIDALAAYLSGEESPRPKHELPDSASLDEPIAIVGMACRVPGADSPDALWRLLLEGRDAVSEVPKSRWDADALYDEDADASGKTFARCGGFLNGIERFDAAFFGISPREALRMDPQQRILLETTWEALENTGIPPSHLAQHRVGTFLGMCNNDYAQLLARSGLSIDGFFGTGNSQSVAVNRIAYAFDFRGPSFAIDAACASSLVAVHQACNTLRTGECSVALAAGVNATLIPDATIALSHARMLSPGGRCRSFDADADGYVRGEGCGVVVLKRLKDAERDGDSIVVVIRGSATNHDGRSNGLTAPSRFAQEAVIQEALARAGREGSDIGFVETQGTGTQVGDAIEAEALANCYGHDADEACWLGAMKTNIGHLEGASGIVSLIKAALAVEHGMIPGNLHCTTPNPGLRFEETRLQLPSELEPWTNPKRVAGVSAFGFGGTNAHLVLENFSPENSPLPTKERPWHVLTFSAKTESARTRVAERLAQFLAENTTLDLGDVGYTLNTRREQMEFRGAVVTQTIEEAIRLLENIETTHEQVRLGQAVSQPFPAFNLLDDADAQSRSDAEWKASSLSLASLHVRGIEIDWAAFDTGFLRRRIGLPNYPFEATTFWPETNAYEPDKKVLPEQSRTYWSEFWSLDPCERSAYVTSTVRMRLVEVLEVPDEEVDSAANLVELGLDSLMMMELAAHIERDWRIEVGQGALVRSATLGELGEDICSLVIEQGPEKPLAQPERETWVDDLLAGMEEGRL